MTASEKLKLCNRWLGCIAILMLVSGIQLEATAGKYEWFVWAHIVLGIIFTILAFYHIKLHYWSGNWFSRFAKNRNTVTRILWWVFLLTCVSGIAALVVWCNGYDHSPLGGVHGKIGFLMVLLAIIHVAKHIRKRKKSA